MPQFENLITKPFTAEGAVTQFAAVAYGTNDKQAKLPGGAGAACIGIALHAAADGEQLAVAMPGSHVRAISAGAISRGAWLRAADTAGKVGPSTAVDQHLIGQAVSDVSNADEVVFIRVDPNPPVTVT